MTKQALRGREPWLAALAGLLLVCASGCAQIAPKRAAPAAALPGIINQPGDYDSPHKTFVLSVGITNGIVQYTVNAGGRQRLAGNAGSAYQRWFFFWDKTGRLWVHSSDIGDCLWIADGSGKWVKTNLKPDSGYLKEIPDEVKQSLPSSTRKMRGLEG